MCGQGARRAGRRSLPKAASVDPQCPLFTFALAALPARVVGHNCAAKSNSRQRVPRRPPKQAGRIGWRESQLPRTGPDGCVPRAAEYFEDRSDVQCLHRWQKVLNPELVKGPWTAEARPAPPCACVVLAALSERCRVALMWR